MPEHCLRQVELGMYHVPERIDLSGGVDLGGPTPLINPSLVVLVNLATVPLSLSRERYLALQVHCDAHNRTTPNQCFYYKAL